MGCSGHEHGFRDGGTTAGQVVENGLSLRKIGDVGEDLVRQGFCFQQGNGSPKSRLVVGVAASNLHLSSYYSSRIDFA